MSNKKLALLLACCAAAGTVWSCSEPNDNSNSIPCAENGKKVCLNGGAYVCSNGELDLIEQCGGVTPFCDEETFRCVANNQCKGNQATCENNVLLLCENGSWKVLDQCLNMICDASTRTCKQPPVVCTPGCRNGILTTCTNGMTNTPCPNGCNAEGTACETVVNPPQLDCTAGETRCENDMFYSCINGSWNAGEPCAQDESCGLDENGKDACVADTVEITTCKLYVEDDSTYFLQSGESRCIGEKAVSCDIPANATESPDVTVEDCSSFDDHICVAAGIPSDGKAQCVENTETPCELNGSPLAHGASVCSADHDIVSCQDGSLNTTECDADAPCADVNGKLECHKISATDCEVPNGFITSGTGLCIENTYKLCEEGTLNDEAVCSGDTPICDADATGYCRGYKDCSDTLAHGATLCNADNTAIVSCTDGVEDTVKTCDAPAKCELQDGTPACVSSAPVYTTIKAIKDAYDTVVAAGALGLACDIEVTGVVTASRGSGATIFFQDGSAVASDQAAGIYIYNSAKDLGSFAIGDNVKVTAAELLIYNGQLEIVNATVEKTNATDTVIPAEINDISTILETTEEAKNPYNLMLVTLKNVTSEDGKTIKDSASHSINVSTYIAKNLVSADTTFRYDITGIVNFNKSSKNTIEEANGLAPRSADDIVAVGCIDANLTFTPATASEAAKCESSQPGNEFCAANETSYTCKTIDSHNWRVVCENGTSKTGEMGTIDCTAAGQICIAENNDAYCAICSETDVSLCTENIPEHAKHICEMGFVPACGWECEGGYVLNDQKDGCVLPAQCAADVCDGNKIKICDKQTGQLSAAQDCTGNDTHGVYACSDGACGLASCTNGYHIENGACVANCTTDVCDGNKIKICDKQTGILSAAQNCTGSDGHGVYACSNNICALSSCTNGYHIENGACIANCTTDVCDGDKIKTCNKQTGVLSAAQACTGNDTHGVYACANNACGLSSCTNGYHLENGACVANCTTDVCDGNQIRICNKQTGVLAAAQACTGNDTHGVYACSNNACGLSGCANGYHLENGVCTANCTTDVCDGARIRVCNKQTGVLAAATDCTGNDPHGVYACSNKACALSSCVAGYHKEGSTCVKDPASSCTGTNWVSSATYTVAHEGYGCNSETQYFICQDGSNTALTDSCGNSKPYCNPAGTTTQNICVECLTDTHCEGLDDTHNHEVGYCTPSLECDIKCETAYAIDTYNDCTRLSASFRSISEGHGYAQINELTFPDNSIENPRFACTTDRSQALSAWTELAASVNNAYDNGGGNNVEYMADLTSLKGTNYCTFLFDVDGTTYIAEKEDITDWLPTAATGEYVFPNETPLWQYEGAGGGELKKDIIFPFGSGNNTCAKVITAVNAANNIELKESDCVETKDNSKVVKIELTYPNGVVLVYDRSATPTTIGNTIKKNEFITVSNLATGSTLTTSIQVTSVKNRPKNYLDINSATFIVPDNYEQNQALDVSYNLGKSATSVTLSHAGGGTNAITFSSDLVITAQ